MFLLFSTLFALLTVVSGHGYLMDPVARNAMWKFGYPDAPKNYNLMALYCGGIQVQYQQNQGKCGICGDPFNGERRHEVGGRMYDGRIVKKYNSGATIDVRVKLTANHMGYFSFKICPSVANPEEEVTQECLDSHILDVTNTHGNDPKKFKVLNADGTRPLLVKVKLPRRMTCERCVLQWIYTAGNNWGCETPGDWRSCGLGKGNQETFVNCADIKIE